MSVTHSFPKTVTDDTFAQIFALRTKNNSNKTDEVISTLASTVDQLEEPMRTLGLESQQDNTAAAADVGGEHMRIEVRHPDGSESNVYVQLNAMSGQFLPFQPPPAPRPASVTATTKSETTAAARARSEEAAQATPASETRIYRATFTLEETVDANGETRIVAHSPQLVEEEGADVDADASADAASSADAVPRTFLERMAQREVRLEEYRMRRAGKDGGMLAISVRRQRKLKMKKKKYKKLMKRTRNERRKLDRV